jgi:hypothetical protein
MQLEDVLRIRNSDEQNRLARMEAQQQTLVDQLNKLIKRRTVDVSERNIQMLRDMIKQLEQD